MIREITVNDYKAVEKLIVEAFSGSEYGYQNEAELVEKIRAEDTYLKELELVEVIEGKMVGHALLSQAVIQNETKEVINKGLVLAPLSVLPTHQGKGIGKRLIKASEEKVANQYSFISILGSPSYYSRFGYEEAAHFGIKAPFEVPSEYFLIKEMTKDGLESSQGILVYNAAFD